MRFSVSGDPGARGEHDIGRAQQGVESDERHAVDLGGGDVGIVDEHVHADGDQQRGEMGADRPVADDASGPPPQLPSGALCGRAALRILERRDRDVACHVEQQTQRQLRGGGHEALVGASDQDTVRRRRLDVDRGRVDRTSQEGDQVRQLLEDGRFARCRSVGDDDVTARRRLDQLGRGQVAIEGIRHDIRSLREQRECPPVVRLAVLGIVGQEHSHRARR
jgi:hypothetical protein